MSYTRTYQIKVPYSGTESVKYPKSDTGGTLRVHYEGSVPVTASVNVHTEPFDESIARTGGSLLAVAGAVSAAEAAQIKQIQESCAKITDATLGGFFGVLSSELSASVSQHKSRLSALTALVMEQSAAIVRVRANMAKDYQNLKHRYVGLFDTIDDEMRRQIMDLDHEAYLLRCDLMANLVNAPFEREAASAAVCMVEQDIMQMKMSSARTKGFVSSSLSVLASLCAFVRHYTDNVSQVVEDPCDTAMGEGEILVPVVYMTRQEIDGDGLRLLVLGDLAKDDKVRKQVLTAISLKKESSWSEQDASERQEIDSDFGELLEEYRSAADAPADASTRERVCQVIKSLYAQSAPQTLRP